MNPSNLSRGIHIRHFGSEVCVFGIGGDVQGGQDGARQSQLFLLSTHFIYKRWKNTCVIMPYQHGGLEGEDITTFIHCSLVQRTARNSASDARSG